jgi:small subunit ribosomal protein S5
MTEEIKTTTKTTTPSSRTAAPAGEKRTFGGKRPFKKRQPEERAKPEFDQKIMNIRRVTRVMAGGRRFSFSVAIVIGDKKGSVGIGVGKAGDTSLAIQKAVNHAKKNMVTLNLTEDRSFTHEVTAKFNSARVMMMPNGGRGLVAGSAIRSVLELAGVHNVTGKAMSRTKNQINIARATIKALESFSRPYVKKVIKKEEGAEKTAPAKDTVTA